MVINIILAILVLSIIIIIHEFGHFIVAKANGITVVEFSLGFGPKLIHFKKGETEYSLKLLPFGGACIMLGEDFLEADDDEQEDATEGNNTGKAGSELDNDFCNGKTAEDMALAILQGIHLIIHRLEAICLRRKSRKHWKLAMICPNHLLISQCGQGLQL